MDHKLKEMKILLFVCLTLLGINANAQSRSIAFYNVENLFDTIDGVNDDAEFLPNGSMHWNSERYKDKIVHINQVIDQMENPLFIGMCEVENASVVRDVMKNSVKINKYGLVHYDSPDHRGIDVALIYDSSSIQLAQSGRLTVNLPGVNPSPTRDVLWAKFANKKDSIVVMINHWPSRRGGQEESDKNRMAAAETARLFIDSLLKVNKNYKIIFMGDLNDYPNNNGPKLIGEKLRPMICSTSGDFGGSYLYNNEWNVLDHIFVSDYLLKKGKGLRVVPKSGKIHAYDFILTEYKGNTVPFRTYAGTKYLGGYSDHLPVSIQINYP